MSPGRELVIPLDSSNGNAYRYLVKKRFPIALRIALLVWLVSLLTLLLFVFVTIPQQKEVFIQNLESKALGVVVALRDIASSSAIREDFASLVSASNSLISGDPDLNFVVINKVDGFGIFTQRSGWTFENEYHSFWEPSQRIASAKILEVPTFDMRSFYYSYPFDYSGIQWGWIHVGLSLDNYDASVSRLYWNTFVLSLLCLFLSLVVAIVYSRRVIYPLLRLREVVQNITSGDLQARAEVNRADEVGDLALSVNLMATAIEQRDKQLQGVANAIQALISDEDIQVGISKSIALIGPATNQDRAYYHDISFCSDSQSFRASRRYEWLKNCEKEPRFENQDTHNLLFQLPSEWFENLNKGRPVGGITRQMPNSQCEQFHQRGVLSLLILPVQLDASLVGLIGLENSSIEYQWTDNEIAILASLSASVSSALKRFSYEQEILEAKSLLEDRVTERTKELQNQVLAKENALLELAEAQTTLMNMSRSAGMAEVATGILHNVGNVLNSVNVSCNMIMEQLRTSRVENVSRTAELLTSHKGDFVDFLCSDKRGQRIPDYLETLGDALVQEKLIMQSEARSLHDKIEHIKEIVAMQQTYGKVVGLIENLPPEQLMEDALRLNADALERHHIKVYRNYSQLSNINTDKHKVLQILLNLINNAKQACAQASRNDKSIILKLEQIATSEIQFIVSDNGVGISAENLIRIFQHGFTTRRDGHGFGLHSGALAAKSLGGSLSVISNGLGKGATFTLTLPLTSEKSS